VQLELELAELIMAPNLNLGTKFSLFFFCCVVAEFKSKKNLSAILVVVVVVDVPVRALASPDLTNSFTNLAISISDVSDGCIGARDTRVDISEHFFSRGVH